MNKNMNMKDFFDKTKVLAAVLATVALTACSTTKSAIDAASSVANTGIVADQASNVVFPEIPKAWFSEGDFVNVENLRKVAPGLTKDELYYLLKPPHFSEGLYGVRKWNYIFNFRTGNGGDYVTCQYQIHFDKDYKVSSTYWKDQACANFLIPAPPVRETIVRELVAGPAAAPIVMQAPVVSTQQFNIAGDVLFNFNKHTSSDMRNEGRAEIQKIAATIKDTYKSVDVIRVIGHTDPLATMDYNFDLSLKRAQTVRNQLISFGLDGRIIQVKGAGETELVKTLEECRVANNVKSSKDIKGGKGKKSSGNAQAVQECLLPNRRVAIEVIGIKN
jgi:OmpA-OmpF porin, OOP family